MIDVYWSANSPFCWRVLLTLELKGLAWRSFPMQTDLQAHKAPQMLAMNPRGRLPVVKDGDYVVFESLAVHARQLMAQGEVFQYGGHDLSWLFTGGREP